MRTEKKKLSIIGMVVMLIVVGVLFSTGQVNAAEIKNSVEDMFGIGEPVIEEQQIQEVGLNVPDGDGNKSNLRIVNNSNGELVGENYIPGEDNTPRNISYTTPIKDGSTLDNYIPAADNQHGVS